MVASSANSDLPKQLQIYIGLVGLAGVALLAYLVQRVEWDPSTVAETTILTLLVVVAGSFPLPVAPRVKADVNTAVLFGAALVLSPGAAALAGVVGVLTYTSLLRFWGDKLRLPWYKYPFNAGQVALLMGLTSAVFQGLSSGDGVLTAMVVPAAAIYYVLNTSLVSGAASIQLGLNPLRVWWMGTREYGPMVLALLAFGFLGAVVYRESPWTVVALFIPVAIIYVAFSKLARTNSQLEEAKNNLEALQGRIVSSSKLASIGALSLDLAHQIKNPLTVVLGRLEGLQDRFADGTKEQHHLETALEAVWRIQQLTQTFAAIGEQKWVSIDLRDMLDEAVGMASIRSRKMYEITRHYQEGMVPIRGNPVLIREALSNLFSNAIEAVHEATVLKVKRNDRRPSESGHARASHA